MSIIDIAIRKAELLIGTKETGHNHGAIIDHIQKEFGLSGAAWCVMFVLHCFKDACLETGLPFLLKWTASSQLLFRWADSKGYTYFDPMKIKRGDIAIWQNGATNTGHCGLVTSDYDVTTSRFNTIEGNTGSGELVNRDGDGVYARNRNASLKAFRKQGLHLRGFIDIHRIYGIE